MMFFAFLAIIVLNIFCIKSQNNCTRITYFGNNTLYMYNVSGMYNEYYDCQREQNGTYLPWFGGVNYTRCYKKNDGSTWQIWNTGCGWTIGNINCNNPSYFQPCIWDRSILYYTGQCSNISSYQSSEYGLNTNILYNGFGEVIGNLSSEFGNCDNFIQTNRPTIVSTLNTIDPTNRPTLAPTRISTTTTSATLTSTSNSTNFKTCFTNITYIGNNTLYKYNVSGIYDEYNDCKNPENGVYFPVFNNVNYSTCYKKNDGSSWMIWNSGCGWGIGNKNCDSNNNCYWDRYVLYYTGLCSNITRDGLNQNALTTTILYNNFGTIINGLTSQYNNCGKKTTASPTLIRFTARPTGKPTQKPSF